MIGEQWLAFESAPAPVVGDLGPFPRRPFLQAVTEHDPPDQVMVVSDQSALVALELRDGVLGFAGHEDLVDYRTPLGAEIGPVLQRAFDAVGAGVPFRFDSLPEEAAGVLLAGLDSIARPSVAQEHTIVARLALPDTHDAYLGHVGKKQRHEIRRKARRFQDTMGAPTLTQGSDAFGAFIDLHRRSDGEKGSFMTPHRADFFEALLHEEGWLLHSLEAGGRVVAAAFGFRDGSGYYLYNSAYDPESADASPGIVMLSMLIEDAVANYGGWFDFLKGDEVYKFRLGAQPRQLFVVEGIV